MERIKYPISRRAATSSQPEAFLQNRVADWTYLDPYAYSLPIISFPYAGRK